MLEPDTLRAFVAIADCGHFVRAADSLDAAQSVVSKRLRRLEDRLGMRLVDRDKRKNVALTRAGEIFLPEARSALAALERTEQLGVAIGRGEAGPVRIAYVFSAIMTGIFPRMIRNLRVRLPEIDVQPCSMETPEQLSAVVDGKIDFGIVRPRPSYSPGITASVVHSEDVVVALASDHPLAQRSSLKARDIAMNRMIVPQFHEEVGLIDIIRGVARAGAVPLPDVVRTTDFISAAGLAAAGIGLVLAPRSLSRLGVEGISFRDLADHRATLDLVLICRDDAPAALRDVLLAQDHHLL